MEHTWQFFAVPGEKNTVRAVAICSECGEARHTLAGLRPGKRLDLTGECPGRPGRSKAQVY